MHSIRNLLALAVIVGLAGYAVTRLSGTAGSAAAGPAGYAGSACADAISARFDGQAVRPYATERNAAGYVVRASVEVRGKQPAKAICLTNEHGGVEEIRIIEW